MSYNNRGNYGNNRGNYQGNRGGNSGGNYSRGGSNAGPSNNRSGNYNAGGNSNSDQKYVRSSSFVKEVQYQDGKKEKEFYPEGITEKIDISLTADKAAQLIDKIQAAVNQPDGDGGIRITMYCQHKFPERGPSYDSANIMVVGKYPPKNGGSFNGGGRRDYPEQQSHSGYSGNGNQASSEQVEQPKQPTFTHDPAADQRGLGGTDYEGTTRW